MMNLKSLIIRRTFLEFSTFLFEQNKAIGKVLLNNAPANNPMTFLEIQKDITYCFGQEIVKSIVEDIDGGVFSILMDCLSDLTYKQQMALVVRYVDKMGIVKERFIGLARVEGEETTSQCLKSTVDSLLTQNGLNIHNVRGQGYDGVSNMRDELNGLRALILRENSSAYYVHCFAHQLQLVVVALAKQHYQTAELFDRISLLMNVVGASCKQRDIIRESYRERIKKAFGLGTIETGLGVYQELSLQRPENTNWDSHYRILTCVIELYPNIIKVLEYIEDEGTNSTQRGQAYSLLVYFQSFLFVFHIHLTLVVLGITETFSQCLQKKDLDISNAISIVRTTKARVKEVRDEGWDSLIAKITSFCERHDLPMWNLDDEYFDRTTVRKKTNMTARQNLQVERFYTVMDTLLQELNDRFDEVNSELLVCMASLSPADCFRAFDQMKLTRLSEFYPNDFDFYDRVALSDELHIYIGNVKADERFHHLNDISDLARMMVDTNKHVSFSFVYKLLKLTLTLPVATATVERCFSAIETVKTNLRNWNGDRFVFDCLLCYIEKDIFETVSMDCVMDRFRRIKTHREL